MTINYPTLTSGPLRPEFFRLPARGPDPIFGLSRSFYYSAEKAGKIRMIRLRKPGSIRGIVLVPVVAVSEFIRKHSDEVNL